jgi:large subunit ribosomal protein L10
MDKTQKQAFVGELNQGVAKANAMIVAHYRGLTVKDLTTLRREVANTGGRVQVAKNRLAKLAFKGTSFEQLSGLMSGPTLIAYGDDMLTASKATQQFADKNDKLVILGGVMDGKNLSTAEIKTLSKLPGLNELRGKLVGLLQAPGAQIARVLKAYADKAPVSGDADKAPAAAEPPKAEAAPSVEAAAPAPAAEAAPAEAPAETPNA